ncbi:D-alanine--poly(phosphoribitol) ligase subunit 1 [Phocoenobacter uteri]|uniref:D-alanine--poly(Phosphoribitol) ligase subunit 1 n=1 Tax=Phocoenobacter uteri TaxID=146806 RepID=A0A379CCG5_9PAST|nr:AMP-binding protein [Phocoenobacter uteri]MDG6881408.1 D-alanine--D-alanine ligase [Phocoenobacter uteri]SUB59436.1 D-alanine--poly(phosphoribitol) ligase subunit 1 [Phocoenobacter uteri]
MNELSNLLFKRLVGNTSENIAIENSKESCSWKELSEKITVFIKQYKQLCCADKNNPLIIYGHKEIDFVVAIYGCLLHKIPFIPLDNIYPLSRVNDICEISKACYIYHTDSGIFEQRSSDVVELEEKDLAYLIFTSGTTGKPKGVQIGRESVSNLILWMRDQLRLSSPNIFMNQCLFSFDVSIFDLFGALIYESKVVLNSREDIANPNFWLTFLQKTEISTWVSTPSFALQQLMNPKFNSENLPSLKEFFLAGESLSKQVVTLILNRFPNARVINGYGPTEATIISSFVDITAEMLDSDDDLPIGFPVLNSTLSIDNGEICTSGIHVMRGYLNNPEENSKHLFLSDSESPLYRTGDCGYEKDGLVYCQGRIDEQIKLNGYRIELSEIEAKIFTLKEFNIEKTAVIALRRASGTVLRLVGFYTTSQLESISEAQLKESLQEILPSYMVPSELIKIDEIPTSVNHKVDKKALLQKYFQEKED